ncbi:hypothetical protein DdX_14532 [Ditylenchus destructor]|uniref:Uncharacterized protein n=1 Tax=Ditylenchus destructor TaxID=166010 RepID=A0AAD4MUG5_9BILA|nr:hypothetical protein DdX_14532 [Ditylenchus destructor]
MARTKQTAFNFGGGKAPRKQFAIIGRQVAGGAPKQLPTTAAPSGGGVNKPHRPDESSIMRSANQTPINDNIESTISLGQEKKDLEVQCAKLNDELLKKDSELEAVKANLQVELNQLSAELQQCNLKLAKAEEENRELKQANERISHEFELKLNQMESEKEADANSLTKINETMAEIERDYITFINNFSSQVSRLKEKNNKLNEENEMLRADHKVLDRERVGLKVELDSVSANSRELQAELETSKKSIGELTIKLEKLKAECQRPSNLFLTPQPQKVREFPLNLPGPSSVMPAVRRKTVDLNATIVLHDTIDQPKNVSDDQMGPPNKKIKRKSK